MEPQISWFSSKTNSTFFVFFSWISNSFLYVFFVIFFWADCDQCTTDFLAVDGLCDDVATLMRTGPSGDDFSDELSELESNFPATCDECGYHFFLTACGIETSNVFLLIFREKIYFCGKINPKKIWVKRKSILINSVNISLLLKLKFL